MLYFNIGWLAQKILTQPVIEFWSGYLKEDGTCSWFYKGTRVTKVQTQHLSSQS